MQSLLLSGVSGGGEILRNKRQKNSRPLRGGKEKENRNSALSLSLRSIREI